MTLKQKIYNHYFSVVNEKIINLEQVLAGLKESGSNETKSTAGDKHETALAMLQIEQANTRSQLEQVLLQKSALLKIDPTVVSTNICMGSVIKTNKGYFYFSAALGKALVEGINILAISPLSPLGVKLKSQLTGNEVILNNNNYIIESIQ